jgi:hypothetical protein
VVGNRSAVQPPLVADDGNHVRPISQ